jgi:hypothetical protein
MSKQTNASLSPVWKQLEKHGIVAKEWKDGGFPLYVGEEYVGSLHFSGNEATPCFFSDKKREDGYIRTSDGERIKVSHMKMYNTVSGFAKYGI